MLTDLAGVQGRRLRESDDHITIRLPPLFAEVTGEMFGKCVRCEIAVCEDFLVVGHAEGNDIFIGSQTVPAGQGAQFVGRLAAQQVLDLLGDDRAAEHPREGIFDGGFQLAVEPLYQTHLTAYLCSCARGHPPRVAPLCCFTCMVSVGGAQAALAQL